MRNDMKCNLIDNNNNKKANTRLKRKTLIAAHPRELKKLGNQKRKLQGCNTSRHPNKYPEGPTTGRQPSLEATSTILCLHLMISTIGNQGALTSLRHLSSIPVDVFLPPDGKRQGMGETSTGDPLGTCVKTAAALKMTWIDWIKIAKFQR